MYYNLFWRKKKYYFVCEKCGCEFCSDGEEIVNTKSIPVTKYILCPECENKIHIENLDEHFYKKDDDKDIETLPSQTELVDNNKPFDKYFNISYHNACESCAYYQSLKNNDCSKVTVGDTPCTFCQKNLPMC